MVPSSSDFGQLKSVRAPVDRDDDALSGHVLEASLPDDFERGQLFADGVADAPSPLLLALTYF